MIECMLWPPPAAVEVGIAGLVVDGCSPESLIIIARGCV